MTVHILKYPQVVWAYFILDAATIASSIKLIDLPRQDVGYQVEEESSDLHPVYQPINFTMALDQTVLPSKLGLFVSQPPNVQHEQPGPESRYGLVFGRSPVTKKRRGIHPESLSLFTKVDKGRQKDIFEKYRQSEHNKRPVPLGSDRYLTPQFVKFKNEIEKETEKTHVRGMKMSKDAMHAPTVVYENPVFKKYKSKKNYFDSSPIPSNDESYRKPFYADEPAESYDKPTSYQRYSSTPTEPYLPPNFESADVTYPPYPPYPDVESEPYHAPRSESEARNPPYSFPSSYNFPSAYHSTDDSHSYPFPKSGKFPLKDEEELENDYTPEDYPPLPTKKPPRKFSSSDEYNQADDVADIIRHNSKQRRNRWGRPYGEPSEVPISVARNQNNEEDEDEEFEANFEAPTVDPFTNDEEKESEEEEETPPIPKGRLKLPSRQQPKRVPAAGHRKRCVKKRKEMLMDDLDDEPGRQMACLVCENLETGGTYETCSYESDPKKNSYFQGNSASYRKGNSGNSGRPPYQQRYKRDTVDVAAAAATNTTNVTDSLPRIARHSLKAMGKEGAEAEDEDSTGSYSADPADFGPENFAYDEDDDHEELQEDTDDNDELEEYKPQPPAYANEQSCKEVVRGGATCMVCQNPETNGKYEQCSYANEPDDAYEYAQSSSYGRSNDNSPKDRFRRSKLSNLTASAGATAVDNSNATNSNTTDYITANPVTNNFAAFIVAPPSNNSTMEANTTESVAPNDLLKDLRGIEQRKIEQVNEIFKALVRTKKEQPDSRFLSDIEDASYEKQFLNLFPELSSGGTEADESMLKELATKPIFGKDDPIPGFKTKTKLAGYFKGLPKKSRFLDDDDDTGDGELSKMMRDFKTKDRSKCAKKMKDKMTCYVCHDKDGMKREECMYVVENEPKKATFHELKDTDIAGSSSKTSKREIPAEMKRRKYKFNRPGEMQPASQTVVHQTIEARKYGSPVTVPDTYSNVQIRTEKTYSHRGAPSNFDPVVVERRRRHRRSRLQPSSSLLEPDANASDRRTRFKRGRIHGKGGVAEEDEDADVNTQHVEDPEENGEYTAVEVVPEADPSSPNGAFSDDTEVVYDAELKTSLPKFMVEKSEHEAIVDDFMSRI